METYIFVRSASGLPSIAYDFLPRAKNSVLILGGVHGLEVEGVAASWKLIDCLMNQYSFRFRTCVVPAVNVDGVLKRERLNARGVDLNRNLPTKDWTAEILNPKYPPGSAPNSEVENQALTKLIENLQPKFILSLHSFERFMLNTNGNCGAVAEAMKKVNGYPIEASIGYPTPGCLGTYAGIERGIPTLTYEIERGLSFQKIVEIHVPAILAGLYQLDGDLS